ncbi:hypothetical protein TNCV_2492071 [Trichonephila clavipes]|nr:hypothetical protein TNCV_2492071 [Trichonephila clavipes]
MADEKTPQYFSGARVDMNEPTATLITVQTQTASSLRVLAYSRTIARRMAEGHLVSQRPIHALSMTPTHRLLRSQCVTLDGIGLQRNGTGSSSVTNLDSISAVTNNRVHM